MEATGISIISPTTLADVAPSPHRKSGNSKISSVSLPSGNKIHAAEETLKEKNGWLKQLLKDDTSWWQIIVSGLAELLGTAILIFVGCMGCVGSLSAGAPSSFQTALTMGFTVTCIIHSIGHISVAHINPAVTICSLLLGLKSLTTAGVYIIAQILGAIIGYGLLKVVIPVDLLHNGDPTSASSFCVTAVHPGIFPVQALLTETVATGVLVLLCCASWDPRNGRNTDSTAIKFGLTVAALSTAAGPFTGCSMNPARSFGPALWNNSWDLHWIYWLGPVAGSIIFTLAYKTLFWPKEALEKEIPESVALNSVDSEKREHN